MVNIEITSTRTRTANRPEIRDTVADTPIIEAYRRVRTQKSDIVTTHSDQRDATMDATVNHVNGVASRGPVACRSCCHARARDRRQRALPRPPVPVCPCRVAHATAAELQLGPWSYRTRNPRRLHRTAPAPATALPHGRARRLRAPASGLEVPNVKGRSYCSVLLLFLTLNNKPRAQRAAKFYHI